MFTKVRFLRTGLLAVAALGLAAVVGCEYEGEGYDPYYDVGVGGYYDYGDPYAYPGYIWRDRDWHEHHERFEGREEGHGEGGRGFEGHGGGHGDFDRH